ncbi:hypothetical protein K474DRAFT_583721 [Panus rudis PR-1116 ss-1]|nr:hypothetical protein K474DRAFT_583721 [Panus rudis PR-1116 ss-1]
MNETPNSPLIISVSTAFYPGADVDPMPSDTILISSDSVYFHVHRHRLLNVSSNAFNSLLSGPHPTVGTVLNVPEQSTVLNVVLHAIYGISCNKYGPSLDLLLSSIPVLEKYGVAAHRVITPETHLFNAILTQAPLNAIEVYMVAAEHDLFHLAQAVSPYLLSFPLPTLTDEMAKRMGSLYLKRLFFLHMNRSRTLSKLTVIPPKEHPPTTDCGYVEQKKLIRAWSLACASLAWDARPDLSPHFLGSVLSSLGAELTCDLCKVSLNERITEVLREWTITPRMI